MVRCSMLLKKGANEKEEEYASKVKDVKMNDGLFEIPEMPLAEEVVVPLNEDAEKDELNVWMEQERCIGWERWISNLW
ncbi:hypothetical protein L2E82_10225 [Cichorium intybus]|uniref:Uncharacterized protein n=1 Tax=Cichorium intybus TaxID=13427 RepID=A0ACB9GAL5_CICIN|nr:hypothetical protein L2E82_10225 [Cichorium intybus]